MKKDLVTRRIFAACAGVCAILLCGTLFMYTANTANAANDLPDEFNHMTMPATGSIMMDYTSVHVPSEDKTYYECIVWDTNTGNSKLYYYNYTDKVFKAYGSNVQLPSNPLD